MACAQVFMYYKACPDDNEYAHPMDLCPVVDLYAGKVIHIDACKQPPAIPMRGANYHRYGCLEYAYPCLVGC
jgi:primary-amine oxidase